MLVAPLLATLFAPLALAEVAGFPEPLSLETFTTRIQNGLHLVEFFSPYCSHCKHLAPTWEATWDHFHGEGDSLGIGMIQVDCVASGDLCQQEKITAYPALKLYGPQGFIKNYPKNYKRTEEHLVKFMRDSAIDYADPNFLVQSKSKLITTDAMVRILGEKQTKPQLISFWPSKELADLNDYNKDKFSTPSDEECLDFQRSWSVVSNQVIGMGIDVGHFNCLSNKQICTKLGLSLKKPSVMLVLPNVNVAKVIEYDQSIYPLSQKEIVSFAKRVTEVAQAPLILARDVVERGFTPTQLPYTNSFPESSEVHFVYIYDEETTTTEDLELLPYLIEPLSKLPNTHLYKSNDSHIFNIIDMQKENIYRVINHNEGEKPRELNYQRNTIEMMTTLPTIVAFRENMLLTKMIRSFAPNDIRDQYRVIDWMKEVAAAPGYSEIGTSSYKRFLNDGDAGDKLAVLLLDSTQEAESLKFQHNFVIGVHDYEDLKNEKIYDKLIESRKLKDEDVGKLKEQGAESKRIIRALSKEISYAKFHDVVLGYVDISKNIDILKRFGIDFQERQFNNGDVLILDRSSQTYYETDPLGQELNVRGSPLMLREMLCILNGVKDGKLAKRLRHSPFPSSLRFMEALHQQGVMGYLFILITVFALYKKGPRLWKRQQRKDNLGILGNPSAKAD